MEWRIAGEMPSTNGKPIGFAGPVAGVTNDILVAGGGANFPGAMPWLGGKKKYYDDVYLFKKDNNDSLIQFAAAKLPFDIAYAACVSTPEGIVVAGGENEAGPLDRVLLLKWRADTGVLNISHLPDLPFAVTAASMALQGNSLFLAGGETGADASSRFLFLDLMDADNGWQALPDLPKPVSHAVLAAQSNGIYLIGGRKKQLNAPSDLYSSVYKFDLDARAWQQMPSLPYVLSAGTGIAAGDSSILLFGGDRGETFHQTEELIFAISKESNQKRKEQLTAEKIKVQSAHPGFSKKVLLYTLLTGEWQEAGDMPFPSPVTTVAVPWGNDLLIPGGEIRAGVRTPLILSVKIL